MYSLYKWWLFLCVIVKQLEMAKDQSTIAEFNKFLLHKYKFAYIESIANRYSQ